MGTQKLELGTEEKKKKIKIQILSTKKINKLTTN